MPTATLLSHLAELPFHAQLMFGIVVGSGLLCLVVVAAGALRVRLRRHHPVAGELPPLPPSFPYAIDQLLTLVFTAIILWGATATILPHAATASETPSAFGWGTLIPALAAQIGLYLPMLVRYALLHPWQRPTRPWSDYLRLPLLVWAGIYLAVVLLETSGLTPWIIRASGCPEHQDIILLFSRGDTMQRLYIIICAVLIAPVAEECCFRGFLYTTLKRWGGCVAATIASALLFGAIHASLAQMVPLTLFGIVQCIAYEKVRSLWLPIAVHMLFNTTSLITTALMLP